MSAIDATLTARAQVLDKLYALIRAVPGNDSSQCLSENTAIADLALDSLRLVEIVFDLERHFDCVADEGLIAEAHTLGDVAALFFGTQSPAAMAQSSADE